MSGKFRAFRALTVSLLMAFSALGAEPPLRLLFLGGSSGSHETEKMYRLGLPSFERAGMDTQYTESSAVLNPERLTKADVLLIFKDDGELGPEQEKALLDWVEAGGGLVAVHCASHAFRNSDAYGKLVGGRFARHGWGGFQTTILEAQHPAVAGLRSFPTEDETYVHDSLADDNRVLAVRDEGDRYEPYTWIRRHGKGRIYYSALGHNERTWSQPPFLDQLVQAIRWSAGRIEDSVSIPRDPETNKPLAMPPTESMAHMRLPEGFRVELFAAEPDVVKVMAMTFDERGRLWVIESVDYPNRVVEPGEGRDRIKVCEDTDGDGRADTFTIFADKLNIPTSLEFAPEGLVVAEAPNIWLMKDTNGDDVCDEKRVLYTGFKRHDTHAVHSHFHLAMDGWIYATIGYSGAEVPLKDGVVRFGAGLFRFRTDREQLEFLTSTGSNTWGLGFNDAGHVFFSKANEDHSLQFVIPNRIFESVRGWSQQGNARIAGYRRFHPICDDIRQVDFFDGYTSAAGHWLYTARDFPERYWDRTAFVCEPTGHLIHTVLLSRDGTRYIANDGYNLMASTDPWCAPIEATVGPDGAVWWLDWYNYIVRHNPTPAGFETGKGNAYVTPERDQTHARIYRIVHESAKPPTALALHSATDAELVATLSHPNRWHRITAQRLLSQRPRDRIDAVLWKLIADSPDSLGAAHALSIVDVPDSPHGMPDEWLAAIGGARRSKMPAVREAALRVAPHVGRPSQRYADADPHVQLAALMADHKLLTQHPRNHPVGRFLDTAGPVVEYLAQPSLQDHWLTLAATAVAAQMPLDALREAARIPQATPALIKACRVIAEHLARGEAHDWLVEVLTLSIGAEPRLAEAIVVGMAAGWPKDTAPAADDKTIQAIERLIGRLPVEGQFALLRLSEQWKLGGEVAGFVQEVQSSLLTSFQDSETSEEERIFAIRRLMTLNPKEDQIRSVLAEVDARTAQGLAEGTLHALGEAKSPVVASAIVQRWPSLTPNLRRTALATLLKRKAWTKRLVEALEDGIVDRADLSYDQVAQLQSYPDSELAERASKIFVAGAPSGTRPANEMLAKLLPIAHQHGDVGRGAAVFQEQCAKCHRFGKEGTSIGPDLSGVAVRKREEILTDILDPNRSVEGNFRAYNILTTDGAVYSGIVAGETQTSIDLLDTAGKRQSIERSDIDEMQSSGKSLMPEGFEKLPASDLASLLDYLTQRGKFLPLPLEKAANKISTVGMFYSPDNKSERFVFDDWGPREVDGVPFHLIDPRGADIPNAIVLASPLSEGTRSLARSVRIPVNAFARRIHFLGGVSGWGYPLGQKGSVSMIVRLHYDDGQTEDHPLRNGEHLADYIQVIEVPGSKLAFQLGGRQLRCLSISPRRSATIAEVELLKGADNTAPVVMAMTAELR